MNLISLRQALLTTAVRCSIAAPGLLLAAPVTWNTPSNISGDADVSLTGTLRYAYNLTNANKTVNGVTFTGKSSPTTFDDKVTLTFASNTTNAYTSTSNPFNGLSAGYKSLLVGGIYRDAASATAVTVTLASLTPGTSYAVQIWVCDPRAGGSATRTESVSSSGGNTVTLDFNSTNAAGGVGQYTIGTFTADATTQAFTITATNTQLNAIQLRETVATNNVWSGETNGNWDDATINFSGQNFAAVVAASNSAAFRDTNFTGGAVTNSSISIQPAGVSLNTVTLSNTTAVPYTFTNASGSTGITGTTSILKSGNGTVTFSGGNTYSGATNLNAGVLVANHAAALGTGSISFSGGSLRYGSGITTDWSTQIAGSSGPIAIDTNGNAVTFASGIAAGNTGGLVKSGLGSLSLDGLSSYTGNTTVSAGKLTFSGADIADNSKVEIATGATLNLDHTDADVIDSLSFDGVLQAPGLWGAVGNSSANQHDTRITGTGLLVVSPVDVYWDGTGTSWNAPVAWSASATSATPDLFLVPDATNVVHFSASTVTTAQDLTLDGDQKARGLAFTASNATSITGGSAARSLTLGTSGITIAAGTGPVAIGLGTPGGEVTLLLAGNQTWSTATGGSLTVENPIDLGSSTLTLGGSSPSLLGHISGTGALVNNTSGAFSLPDGNSYTGGTTTNAGSITLYGDDSAANGGWSIGPSGANITTVNFETGSKVNVASGKTVRIGNNVSAGTANQTLNVYGTVTNAGALYVGRPGVLSILQDGAWTQAGTMSLNGQGGYTAFMSVNSGGSFTYTGSAAIDLKPAADNSARAVLTIDGGTFTTGMPFNFTASTGSVGGNPGNGRVILTGGGTLKLSATLPAITTGAASGTLAVGGGDGGIIDTNGFNAATDEVIIDRIDSNNNASLGAGSLVKAGAGTLTLTGANTYTGNTTVHAGVLSLSQAYFADTSTVTIDTGAVLNLTHGTADTVAALVLGGVTKSPGTYNAANSGGLITGSGSLVVPAADPFTPWIDSFSALTNPVDKTKGADPDGDGQSNLLEFMLDGNPASGVASGKVVPKITSVSGTSYLTLTLPVRAGLSFTGSGPLAASSNGVNYSIGGSTTLGDFTTAVTEVTPALSSGLPGLSGSGWEYRTFRLDAAVSTAPKGFLRATASEAP